MAQTIQSYPEVLELRVRATYENQTFKQLPWRRCQAEILVTEMYFYHVVLLCTPRPPRVFAHTNSNTAVRTTGSQPSSNLAFLMSGFRFWGSSCASERNWISLPLPIKQERVHYHLQFTMLCIYTFPTYWSTRSFCSFLLHNPTIEMLPTDTAALLATAGWTSCPTATLIHKAVHQDFSMDSQKGSYIWLV